MEEKIYYDNGDVKVTNTRVVTNKQTYVLKNISLVESEKTASSSCLPVGVIIAGIGTAALGSGSLKNGWPFILTGLILVGMGVYLAKMSTSGYVVKITTNSGNSIAYTSYTKSEVDNVIRAINQAIIEN